MPKKSDIGKLASAATKAEFSEKLSSYTSLNAQELAELFPKKSDREELLTLLEIVNSASDENEKKVQIAENIGNISGAVIKLAKKFVAL